MCYTRTRPDFKRNFLKVKQNCEPVRMFGLNTPVPPTSSKNYEGELCLNFGMATLAESCPTESHFTIDREF